MKQYLNIQYDSKLSSTATPPDQIEETLYKFIPSDYTKSDYTFANTVDLEAASFVPLGDKLGSYVLPSARYVNKVGNGKKGKSKAKGKAGSNGDASSSSDLKDLDEESEDAVVFEMYKVSSVNEA